MTIAEKIALCRKTLGISQEELAHLLNISRQAVSRWETGAAMPDTEKIIQLSRVFHVSTDYLLLEEVEKTQAQPENQVEEPQTKEEPIETLWTMEQFMHMRVKERRRKFRMAGWISFLVLGLGVVTLSLILAGFWAKNTTWWYTEWGQFGTGLFRTGNLGVFIAGWLVMIPGIAGLVWEYKRED